MRFEVGGEGHRVRSEARGRGGKSGSMKWSFNISLIMQVEDQSEERWLEVKVNVTSWDGPLLLVSQMHKN